MSIFLLFLPLFKNSRLYYYKATADAEGRPARKGDNVMVIVGINSTRNEDGRTSTTLQVLDAYPDYYNNPDKGRTCVGQKVESVYVGQYDCTGLKVGMEVEVLYDKAVSTKTGVYQLVRRIEIISK